jgi:hypothetical protein
MGGHRDTTASLGREPPPRVLRQTGQPPRRRSIHRVASWGWFPWQSSSPSSSTTRTIPAPLRPTTTPRPTGHCWGKIPDIQRVESAKVFPNEDGSPTPDDSPPKNRPLCRHYTNGRNCSVRKPCAIDGAGGWPRPRGAAGRTSRQLARTAAKSPRHCPPGRGRLRP